MNLITIDKLNKTHGEKIILKNSFLSIEDNDKIGLIGINGTGKTTLLNIIAGIDSPDSMSIITKNSLTIEYLNQNIQFNDELNIIEQVFSSNSPIIRLIGEYENTLISLEQDPSNENLLNKLHELNVKMDAMEAWQLESEAKSILTKLGIVNFKEKIGNLSGGQKKRVALAGVLIRPCDLLILDEPTNHIDNDAIEYLETLLKEKKTALLMVTHDRYFLDRITNTIVELDQGTIHRYKGGYTTYLELKSKRLYDEARIEEKKQSLYKQELEWMRKGVEARRTKAKYRKEAFCKLENSLNNSTRDNLIIDVANSRLGNKILEFQNISKTYKDKPLFISPEYTLMKNDRIGIIGCNGSGKTTFLNILAGKIASDQGQINWGSTTKLGYFTQEQKSNMDQKMIMKNDQKVIEYIKEGAHFIEKSDGTKITAEKMLELFLFPSYTQYNRVDTLSGGEKKRLYLLRILMESPNVLFLDEPTNDLDIETLTILEDYIQDFGGPVIVVSHDRYFLDKICTKIFAFTLSRDQKTKSDLTYILGNYTDYKDKQEPVENLKTPVSKALTKGSKPKIKVKLSYNEQKQWEVIEDEIVALENAILDIEREMSNSPLDFLKLNNLSKEKESLEKQLIEKIEIWEKLSILVENLKQ